MFGLFKKKVSKYGNIIFTFPDGKNVYQLKEEYFEKLPAKKLRYVQENSNYIAYLGISKSTLEVGHKMIKQTAYEISALTGKKDKAELQKKVEDLTKLVDQIDTTRKEYDGTNETIMVSLFDLFFYFDNEDPFLWSEESLELKRFYLNEYPYFRSFFFQQLNDYMKAYKITWQNCISFALAQTTIQEVAKELNLINIEDNKMLWKSKFAENTELPVQNTMA